MFTKFIDQFNPIIIKELRSRMRGPRPFLTLTGMLIVLAGITYAIYRLAVSYFDYYTGVPLSPQIGQMLFAMLSFLLLLFICIITPAVTSNAISSEKENLTYEMLLTTPLHPARILWGKLFSAMSYVFLLIFAAIPIASLIFVFGGVGLREMAKTITILIVIAIATGVFGLFMSTLLKRSARATVISYVLIAALIFGSLIAYVMVGVFIQDEPPRWILVLNPVSALASAMANVASSNNVIGFIPILGADFRTISGEVWSMDHIPRPLYHYTVPLYAFFSIVFYALTTRLILPTSRWKISRKEVLIFLAAIFTLTAVVIVGLFATIDRYERAVVPDNGIFNPFGQGPMIEPAIPGRVVIEQAVEEQAVEVPAEVEILEISDLDLADIYSQALTQVLDIWQENTSTEISSIQLVQTLSQSTDDQSNYTLPEKAQKAISGELEELSISDIYWIPTIDEALNQKSTSLTITLSTLSIATDGTADSAIHGYQQGNLVFEFFYTVTGEEDNWSLIESELLSYTE